jgi:hemolysin III
VDEQSPQGEREEAPERRNSGRNAADERSARETMAQRRDAAIEAMAQRRDAALDALAERRDAALDALAERRDAAFDAAAAARDAAGEAVADVREAAAEAMARVKPKLRGVSHTYAFFVSLLLGAALIVWAEGTRATVAVAIYAASLSALFGVSALYHRVDWRPTARRWMRRLDHTMIFFLIAGTVTPFALLVLEPPLATAILVAVWAGALAGTVVELVWIDSPKWVSASVYVAVGVIGGAIGFPAIVIEAGIGAGLLIAAGGALYITGAIVYAAQRPDPSPRVFGYHEIFHALVIAAAAAHFAAVVLFALPASS